MEPDIQKLNLFYYTNVVHGYFRNAKVQEKAFTINNEKKIATLALPLKVMQIIFVLLITQLVGRHILNFMELFMLLEVLVAMVRN